VFGQSFDSTGTRRGGEFLVSQTTTNSHDQPFVAMRPGGEFTVVWRGGYDSIQARSYDAAGAPVTGEFQVNTITAASLDSASVGFDGAGNFNYCPTARVTREQTAVFLSVTFGLTLYGS
jgi:hypothetical protein